MRMLHRLGFFILLWTSSFLTGWTRAQPSQSEWNVEGLTEESVVEQDLESGKVKAFNGVKVIYEGAVLTADRMQLDRRTGEVMAVGDVYLQQENQIWAGEWLEYNFKSKELRTGRFRTGKPPVYAAGEGLYVDRTTGSYVATNSFVTTDNIKDPAFRVKAGEMTVKPGDEIEAKNAVFYLGKVPSMYFPYYQRELRRHPRYFSFVPGYRSLYGPYLLGSYHWLINQNLDGAFHADYYQKRGLGVGPDLNYDAGKLGAGTLKYYYLRDEEPGTAPDGDPIREHRHRFSFSHAATLRTNLTAKVVVREQSDPFVIRDFFESEFRDNIQPSSFAEVDQLWPNYNLNVLAQPQVNEFFETVERLPDVKLNAIRQKLGVSPFYYEGENSVGYYKRNFAETDPRDDYAGFRADTFQQLTLPKTFFGWLNVTPRAGGRLTHYGDVDSTGVQTNSQTRAVFNTGAEVSLKASRVWRGARSDWLEVDELRHIVEPSINYVYVPEPNRRPRQLPQFDYELPSFELQPITFPKFNSIDAIDSQNVLRFGLWNKLQTKREDGVDNLVNWSLFMDWRIDPRRDQATYSDVFSEMDFRPRSWLTLNSQLRHNINDNRLEQAHHTLTLTPHSKWSLSLGHRYLRDSPLLGLGNNLFSTRVYYKFNENWAIRFSHYFEARDGTLEEHQYTVYRDLRSWTAALSFRVRDNRVGRDDFTVALSVSLKAIPRFDLGEDRNQPASLLGG